jgi:hypothetical protein
MLIIGNAYCCSVYCRLLLIGFIFLMRGVPVMVGVALSYPPSLICTVSFDDCIAFPETYFYLVDVLLFIIEAGDDVCDRFFFLDSSLFDPEPDCS